jgi:hypothetical protein
MTKGLRDYSNEIEEVFEEFMAHLPTSIAIDHKNYTNHYFLSMLIQNSIWGKVDSIIKRPMASAFKAIHEKASEVKEEQESQAQLRNERESRIRNRVQGQMHKFFSHWRFQSSCISMQLKNEDFLK